MTRILIVEDVRTGGNVRLVASTVAGLLTVEETPTATHGTEIAATALSIVEPFLRDDSYYWQPPKDPPPSAPRRPLPPPHFRARHGFAQMAALPCYRGRRTR